MSNKRIKNVDGAVIYLEALPHDVRLNFNHVTNQGTFMIFGREYINVDGVRSESTQLGQTFVEFSNIETEELAPGLTDPTTGASLDGVTGAGLMLLINAMYDTAYNADNTPAPAPEPDPENPEESPEVPLPEAWVQPESYNTYPKNKVVSYVTKIWRSGVPFNAWEPGSAHTVWVDITDEWMAENRPPASTEEPTDEPTPEPTPAPVAEWVQPTGAQDAYAQDINWGGTETVEATHDNPNDSGSIWLYRSKIEANTAEPGRDGTFDRYWEPVAPV